MRDSEMNESKALVSFYASSFLSYVALGELLRIIHTIQEHPMESALTSEQLQNGGWTNLVAPPG